jgi:hypothetical protein
VNDTSIWFGRPGSLRRLWAPVGGIEATRARDTSVFSNKSGGTRTTKALEAARQYVLNYNVLGRASFEYLNQFAQGHMGAGPWVFIDPGRRNLLTVNQSSATSQAGDTRGFRIASGVGSAISSVASPWGGLPRMLNWAFSSSAPASPSLELSKPSAVSGWYGYPVINRPYTFWCDVVSSGGAIDVNLQIDWYGLTGSVVSSSITASAVSTSTTVPKRVALANVTPPATAAWAMAYVTPVSGTIAAGETLSFLDFQLQEGTSPDPQWTGGTGVYPVTFVGMPERYGYDEPGMLVGPNAVLQEVR